MTMMTRHWMAAYASGGIIGTATCWADGPHPVLVSSALWRAMAEKMRAQSGGLLIALTPLSDEPDDAFYPKDRP